jgi:hypothetical protein
MEIFEDTIVAPFADAEISISRVVEVSDLASARICACIDADTGDRAPSLAADE